MSNSFLFIIPLTPFSHLTEIRGQLRKICFNALFSQTYSNWQALVIGEINRNELTDNRFINIDYNGPKEEKLQIATQYILTNKLKCDYIIRLDDDDVFNPHLLKKLEKLQFDLYVDMYHSFFDLSSAMISQKIFYWFPNTCIHHRSHALKVFGTFPSGNYHREKEQPFLIENEHNDFSKYYNSKHKIFFAKKNEPLYLRVLNPHSITSLQEKYYKSYREQHGYFKKNNLISFQFLNELEFLNSNKNPLEQTFKFYLSNFIQSIRGKLNYRRLVTGK
jgi:hypothetical protein